MSKRGRKTSASSKKSSGKILWVAIAILVVLALGTTIGVMFNRSSGRAPDTQPGRVAEALASYMNHGEYREAYYLFTPEIRSQRSMQRFASMAQYVNEDSRVQFTYVRLTQESDTVAYAYYESNAMFGDTSPLKLVRTQKEGWRVDGLREYFTLPTPDFVECLNSRATFYGTDWCPQCQEQIRSLKPAGGLLYVVDCDEDRATCQQEGIQGYPTWKFNDGSKSIGLQDLSTLATRTGCDV